MFLESSQTKFEFFTPLHLFLHLIFDMLFHSGCYYSPMSQYKHAQVNVIERINFKLAIKFVLFIVDVEVNIFWYSQSTTSNI